MGDALISQSTGRFVLKAGDEREAEELIARFNLTPASAAVVRHGLHGTRTGRRAVPRHHADRELKI